MRLCALVRVDRSERVRGVEPATWVIQEAVLERTVLHGEGEDHVCAVPQTGYIRVCAPLTMVQESFVLGV